MRKLVDCALAVRDGIDPLELGLQGLESLVIHCLLIHARLVIVTDLLVHSVALGIVSRRLLKNLFRNQAIAFSQLIESSPAALIRRNRIVLDPIPADELIEVIAGLSAPIH